MRIIKSKIAGQLAFKKTFKLSQLGSLSKFPKPFAKFFNQLNIFLLKIFNFADKFFVVLGLELFFFSFLS